MLPQCHVSSALLYCLTLHCSRNTRVNRLNNHVLTATHGHSDILIHATYNSPLPGLEWSQNAPQRRSGSFLRKRALKTFILRMIHVKIISCQLKSMFSCHLQNTTGQTRHRGIIYQMACCLICCFTYLNEGIGPCLLCRCPPYSCVCTVHP